jgi:hypothetical protein
LISLDAFAASQVNYTQVYIVFRKPSKLAAEKITKRFGTFVQAEGEDMVIHTAIEPSEPAEKHINWLLGMVERERKAFRQLEAAGDPAMLVIRSHTRPLVLPPEALLLAHKLHLPTEIHISK